MLIGYARVSTQDQNLELQRQALQAAGCAKVYEDAMSGLRADRPGLALAMEQLREGDTLVVWKLRPAGPNRQRPGGTSGVPAGPGHSVQEPDGCH